MTFSFTSNQVLFIYTIILYFECYLLLDTFIFFVFFLNTISVIFERVWVVLCCYDKGSKEIKLNLKFIWRKKHGTGVFEPNLVPRTSTLASGLVPRTFPWSQGRDPGNEVALSETPSKGLSFNRRGRRKTLETRLSLGLIKRLGYWVCKLFLQITTSEKGSSTGDWL